MSPEESLIRTFVAPYRQARLLALLSSPKHRRKLTDGLAHFQALDARFVVPIAPDFQTPAGIEALLRTHGAPDTCHVLSENHDLDAREMPLGVALAAVVGRGTGTFLSCIPGRLAYFESENRGERFLLVRPPA